MTSFTVKIRVNDVIYRQITVKMDYTFRKTFCCNIFWISRGAPTWPQQLLSSLSRPQTSVPASLMVNTVFQNKRKTREFGQPYLRSWWPHFMLKLQGMRTSKFWVCGWFALFFNFFFDQQPQMDHGCQDACCKEGYRKGTYVCGVSSPLFPLQLLTYIAVRINKMKGLADWKLSEKIADQSVKTSKRQMTGFFRHDRFSPGNCVIGILRDIELHVKK